MTEEHPIEYLLFMKYMNEEDYFEAHEVLEGYWHSDRIDFYKGLIQIAVGLFHLGTGNIAGARALLSRSHQLLKPYAPEFRALDVARILRYLEVSLQRIPNVVEMEREEAKALGVEPLRMWLEDGTPVPTEVPPDFEGGREDDE